MTTGSGNSFNALIRTGELNRGGVRGDRHTLTPVPLDIFSADLGYTHVFGRHMLEVGLGWEELNDPASGTRTDDVRGFLQWRYSQ
jgi:hypothetical protein